MLEEQEPWSSEELAQLSPRCTDAANADAVVSRHGDGFRFVHEWAKWIAWDGRRWSEREAHSKVLRVCLLVAREEYVACSVRIEELRKELFVAQRKDPDKAKELEQQIQALQVLAKWHTQSQNTTKLHACAAVLATMLGMSLDQLDAHPWLLNVANGTVDLRTAELRDHARDDYLTQISSVEWDDTATCPRWELFLEQVMLGDRYTALYLQRAIGYSLTGTTEEQCLFFCYGGGSNGKSTFLNVVKSVLGEYACAAPRDLLMVQKAPKHETEYARLLGKRLATGAEVGDGQRFDEAKVKDLTGSDVIPARRMNEDFWDLTPTHKLWLAGNYRPTITGSDEGIWRRVRLIPWLASINGADVDRELPQKLRAELPGILRWAVMGCLEWQRHGLGEPTAVLEATETYRKESDVLGQFLSDCCVVEPTGRVSQQTLRERYERWCGEAGVEAMGGRRIDERLKRLGCGKTTVRDGELVRKGWRGVRLKTTLELASSSEPGSGNDLS